MSMENCEKFNDAFIKALNETMKTEIGQSVSKDLAMFCFCNGKTSKKAIKEVKDGFVEALFWNILKEEPKVKEIFAECLYKDLRAEATV